MARNAAVNTAPVSPTTAAGGVDAFASGPAGRRVGATTGSARKASPAMARQNPAVHGQDCW